MRWGLPTISKHYKAMIIERVFNYIQIKCLETDLHMVPWYTTGKFHWRKVAISGTTEHPYAKGTVLNKEPGPIITPYIKVKLK